MITVLWKSAVSVIAVPAALFLGLIRILIILGISELTAVLICGIYKGTMNFRDSFVIVCGIIVLGVIGRLIKLKKK